LSFLDPGLLFLVFGLLLFFRLFYFFFESRSNKKDPVVIWLTGGPGCSSELAMFYENGPFTIANNLSLVWNEYGWDKVSLNAIIWLILYNS
jgi:carboxypeptidase C (cathepsin A)